MSMKRSAAIHGLKFGEMVAFGDHALALNDKGELMTYNKRERRFVKLVPVTDIYARARKKYAGHPARAVRS